MNAALPLKDLPRERELIRRRLLWGVLMVLLGIGALLARYAHLQVVQHQDFVARADSNRVKLQPVVPNRGLIYDRNGRVLADNRPAYRVELVPEQVEDVEATLATLTALLALDEDDLQRFQRERRGHRNFEGVPLRYGLSEEELAVVAVNLHKLPGVRVVPYLTRRYAAGAQFGHLLGYVGRLDEDDLQRLDETNYRGSTHTGKSGIELAYESVLHGGTGVEQVETNAQGRVLRTLDREAPEHGRDLILTIDSRLQQAAWDALGERAGAIVAIDPRNGEILALVSKPAFDPNAFVDGLSQAEYDAILNGRGRPLINRALRGAYEPGSTLKPFVGLAGLETGVLQRDSRIFSSGEYRLPGQQRPYRDWRRGGHGWVEIEQALEESVNSYFYDVALNLGIDRFHDYLAQFGFGQPTGVDLPSEARGVLPSRDWKRGRFDEPWYPGETVIAGIGQGFNVVTPMQLAHATATLAADGQRITPHVLRASRNGSGELLAVAPESEQLPVVDPLNWQAVQEGMRRVLFGERGTARAVIGDMDFQWAGKSGTAQVFGLAEGQEYDEDEVPEHLRHHALFTGFAPFEAPRIALAVVVEHGGGGSSVAAPVAAAVMKAWLDGS